MTHEGGQLRAVWALGWPEQSPSTEHLRFQAEPGAEASWPSPGSHRLPWLQGCISALAFWPPAVSFVDWFLQVAKRGLGPNQSAVTPTKLERERVLWDLETSGIHEICQGSESLLGDLSTLPVHRWKN